MTDAQRREAIRRLIDKHTSKNVVDSKTARDSLIAEGIYTTSGQLRVEFGGIEKKKKKSAA
ncbi:hypothetical protein [Blastochloris viridis]|uniref:Uncharacterized protein n=1 Tax=Blastochloris viridis TaxID=1079 RepID=A0A0H5BHH9_BLAVI|nr:hypothetical protein [Blastochloris viridis]ALK09510.1 hypothetical protein BVIR_1735 [Blastochloris viridis]BAS00605.1 hypothetical protein BV133_3011 [Blastochloris viridis]CUU42173.1 hypothetical protein BVIRIDIS_11800 [Blastochloris viridis]